MDKKYDCFITDIAINKNMVSIGWQNRTSPFFGNIYLYYEEEELKIDSEYKSRDFVEYIMGLVVDKAKIVGEV